MSSVTTQHDSDWPHRLAVLLVCATFPLIWIGGLVTTTKAGMAVPDWPTTYGYNLFLYPWQTWLFGPWDLFIEHGHRLLGALVGMITIGLVVAVFCCDRRPWMRTASLVALGLVVFQGVLGGMRVRLDRQVLAMLHGCVGPLFFSYSVALAVITSRRWKGASGSADYANNNKLHRLTFLTICFTYIQLVLGAQVRHVPVDASPRYFQMFVLFHVGMALVVSFQVALVHREVRSQHRERAYLSVPTHVLVWVTILQLGLGAGAWVVRRAFPDWIANWSVAQAYVVRPNSLEHWLIPTAHAAMGSLILALAVMLHLRCKRLVDIGNAYAPVHSRMVGAPA